MNGNRRNLWIVLGVLVAVACCCLLIGAIVVAAFVARAPMVVEEGFARVTESTEQVFSVDREPTLEIDSLAGEIIVRRGETGQIQVRMTKRAPSDSRLDAIQVDVSQLGDTVQIRVRRPDRLTSNVSVDFEILAPADTTVELETGAGVVEVYEIEGPIAAKTGAGVVRVQGAAAPVALETGAGEIIYEGDPTGDCTFNTGAGTITLELPVDVDAEISLRTGLGDIDLGGFDVRGDVSNTDVQGVLGSGGPTTIDAHTGLGEIDLIVR